MCVSGGFIFVFYDKPVEEVSKVAPKSFEMCDEGPGHRQFSEKIHSCHK